MFSKKLWCKTSLVWALLFVISLGAYLAQAGFKRVNAAARLAPSIAMLAGPTCNIISGFVYYDANNNGIKDVGEVGIANSPLELRNALNVVVGSTTTDASGFYHFDVDATIDTTPKTITHTVSFPDATTDWIKSATIPKFDPALGMLTSVKITNSASITSSMKVENVSTTSGSTIVAKVIGNVVVTVPGAPSITVNILQPHPASPFLATIFDGNLDYAGTSGITFSPLTVSDTQMAIVTNSSDLASYTGSGTIAVNASSEAMSSVTGGGNLMSSIASTASAQVTVIYTYTPSNCLAAGNYKIIQTTQPAGYTDGLETAGNVAPIPGSNTTDFINVTLAGSNLLNNNFGEIKVADLAITKTDNKTTITPGSATTYQIVVKNNGPQAVTNAPVQDTFPASLTNITWTCAGANGGSCGAANGTGNINTTVSLPVNGTATFTVNATVDASASGTIVNTATVTVPPGTIDTVPGNNSSTDTTDIVTQTDLAITKTDGLTTTTVNSLLTYTIIVTNNGPIAVTNAPVNDAIPGNLTNVTWTCSATAGSSCGSANGTGNINTTVDLLVNGKATFIVNTTVTFDQPPVITNTATVATPPNVTDTNPSNNTATDTTLINAGGACPTASAPTTVLGLQQTPAFPEGDLFLLPGQLQFTLLSNGSGNANFFSVTDATIGGNPGFMGVTSLGFAASSPNTTARIISCLDSFRQIDLVLTAKDVTEGDEVRLFLQKADGSGQAVLAVFKFEGGSFKVTQINPDLSVFANGNIPASVGTVIPLTTPLGDSLRTDKITLKLSQASPLADCFQLAIDVTRAGGVGTTSVVVTDLIVNRNTVAGDSLRPETGLLGGLTGGYPTGAKCDASCPTVCEVVPVCMNHICFRPPEYYCSRGIPYGTGPVRIPINGIVSSVQTRVGALMSPTVSRYLGCGTYIYEAQTTSGRRLIRLYIAAQVSIASNAQHPSPMMLQLGCFLMMMNGMPSPLPLPLSNGYTLTGASTMQDLFKQTELAILEGRTADMEALIKIYKSLACGD